MSNINFAGINEQFPVAGQDNDTQVFRDNFDTIKTSLRIAKEELDVLQNPLTGAASLNLDNDFNLKKITNAVFQNCRETVNPLGNPETSSVEIDFTNGSYQTLTIDRPINMTFTYFPGDPVYTAEVTPIGVGKVTLELYSSGGSHVINFVTSGGTIFKKDPDFPGVVTIDDPDNPVFIEVWRRSQNIIFLRYLGQYS